MAIARVLGLPETTGPLPDYVPPPGAQFVFVTVYLWGRLRGCMGLEAAKVNGDEELRGLVHSALEDARFENVEVSSPEAVAVSISLLSNGANMGEISPEEVIRYVIPGRQMLQVNQGGRAGMLLPFWAARESISREAYAREVIDKAGITHPPYSWLRFDCATFLADANGAGRLEGPLRRLPDERDGRELALHLAGLYSNYLLNHQLQDGSFCESYEPFSNRLRKGGNLPRLAHGAWVLARAGRTLENALLQSAAERTLAFLLQTMKLSNQGVWLEMDQDLPSVSEIAFLVLALCQLPRGDYRRSQVAGLAETLWSSIGQYGYIFTHRGRAEVDDSFQNYFPGQVLLALAVATESRLTVPDAPKLDRAFRYYRHRFRYLRDFGQVSWLMQAFSAWWRVTRNSQFSDLVFEIGDWLLQWQREKSGAFINDHQAETPGYTTALYLEGLGAAARLNPDEDEFPGSRRQRYLDAFFRGLAFLNRITIQPGHAPLLPNSDLAVGGLRMGLFAGYVRIDFVQHGLSSVLELYEHCTAAGMPRKPNEEAAELISEDIRVFS